MNSDEDILQDLHYRHRGMPRTRRGRQLGAIAQVLKVRSVAYNFLVVA